MPKTYTPLTQKIVTVSLAAALSIGAALPAYASSTSAQAITSVQTGVIESTVRLRSGASTASETVGYLKQGEQVAILEKTNAYWYKVRTASGLVGYTSSSSKYISVAAAPQGGGSVTAPPSGGNVTPPPASTAAVGTAVIESSVRLRTGASTDSEVIAYLERGDQVDVLEKTNAYWYQVRTAEGLTGYTSSSDKYIRLTTGQSPAAPSPVPSPQPTPAPAPQPAPVQPDVSAAGVEQVIEAGMKYLGTPYEYGSDRRTTDTFDCSDFVRQMFLDGAGLKLPADSRQQGDWVRTNSTAVYDVASLKRGDLMFFMSSIGSSPSAYQSIDKSKQRITHVAMYLGEGKLLHTYSVNSGGVRIDQLSQSWINRFLYGGPVLR